jgi:alanine-synthesizing transaminase
MGAFYMAVVFLDCLLNNKQCLPIANPEMKELVENLVGAPGVSPDQHFVYYLLANTGICVVPLFSFSTPLQSFRFILPEKDKAECERVYRTLVEKIGEYLDS